MELTRQDGRSLHTTDKYTLFLVKDHAKWAGKLERDAFEMISDKAYQDMITSGNREDHQSWMDFHDGIGPQYWWSDFQDPTSSSKRSIEKIMTYEHPCQFIGVLEGTMRANIPNTSYAIELDGLWTKSSGPPNPDDEEDAWWMERQRAARGCRLVTQDRASKPQDNLWYKSTFLLRRRVGKQQLNLPGTLWDFRRASRISSTQGGGLHWGLMVEKS